jgi:hypothetical protein
VTIGLYSTCSYQVKSLILIRTMIETWKKELRAFSRTTDETFSNATLKTIYIAIISMGSIIDSMATKKGPAALHAKAISQLLKLL